MRNKSVVSLMAILAFCGCQKEELKEQTTAVTGGKPFTAVIEDDFSNTKTYLDSDGNVLWKAGNQVSIFDGVTINKQYQVSDDSEGKTSATMNLVSSPGYVGGMEIDNNVAFYPYQVSAGISKKGDNYVIDGLELSSTQTYYENSFGNGAFPMVAVTSSTSDTFLKFKNLLGALKLQLKGSASIVSVSIQGNNSEVLCGDASVTAANGTTPSIELTEASAQIVTLDCGAGVALNTETATSFVIALPPMTMADGFTVVVSDSEGKQMEIKTTKSQTITRSNILKMPAVNYEGTASKTPLTFTSTGTTSLSLNCYSSSSAKLEYKINDEEWMDYTIGDSIELSDGETVSFQGDNTVLNSLGTHYFTMSGNGTLAASGNIMSLLDKSLSRTEINSTGFFQLFAGCTKLTSAPELPATNLTQSCYSRMFYGCTSLVSAPELPATTLPYGCYSEMFSGCTSLVNVPAKICADEFESGCCKGMFYGCTSLKSSPEIIASTLSSQCLQEMFYGCTALVAASKISAKNLAVNCCSGMFRNCTSLATAPELPATTLAQSCYSNMFYGCTSLATAPELPATTLAENCYYEMFSGCTSLITAPELPATILASGCYVAMFMNCTSLNIAPELPAITLVSDCYSFMFYGCKKLNYVKALFTTSPSISYTNFWLSGVSSTGTFVKSKDATWDVTGVNGVPKGWTVESDAYVDLGLSVKWATCNVGASKPEEYGTYFAWGDVVGQTWNGSSWSGGGFSTYPAYELDENNNLKPEYDAAHVNLGGNWRMPTKAELQELKDNCTSTWTTDYKGTGVAGRIFTGKKAGFTDKSIFLPAAGVGYDKKLDSPGSYGYYRSGTFYGTDYAWDYSFGSGYSGMGYDPRSYSESVRPVME